MKDPTKNQGTEQATNSNGSASLLDLVAVLAGAEEIAVRNQNPLPLGVTKAVMNNNFEQEIAWRMCLRKSRYDLKGARTMINAFSQHRGRHGRPEGLRAYSCPRCHGWHVTKAE